MYKEKIFCLKEADFVTVGEWLKSAMKDAGIQQKVFLDRVLKKTGYEQKYPENLVSQIVTGKKRIPKKLILFFCECLDLSKTHSRYYAYEILKVSQPIEAMGIMPSQSIKVKKEAQKKYRESERLEIEKERSKQKSNFNSLLFRSIDDIDPFYDKKLERLMYRVDYPVFSISRSRSRDGGVNIRDALNQAINRAPLTLSIFFNKEFRPVSDSVAMARLYRFYNDNNSKAGRVFENMVEFVAVRAAIDNNIDSYGWLDFLEIFKEETKNFDQEEIEKLLASATELDDPIKNAVEKITEIDFEQFLAPHYKTKKPHSKNAKDVKDVFFCEYMEKNEALGIYQRNENVMSSLFTSEDEDYIDDCYAYHYTISYDLDCRAGVKRKRTGDKEAVSVKEKNIAHYLSKHLTGEVK